MRSTKKLISILVATLMLFSTVSLGAGAAYSEYKDAAIAGSYNSIDKPTFTTAQLASMALDYVDNTVLLGMKSTSFKIPILNATINYSSIDRALDSVQDLYNGAIWNTAKSLVPVLADFNFKALNTDPDGNFAAEGVRRTTANKTDLDVAYSVFSFLKDNQSILAKYGNGTLSLGATIEGLLGDKLATYMNPTYLIRDLLIDKVVYKGQANKPAYTDVTIDQLVSQLIPNLLLKLNDYANDKLDYGIDVDFTGLVDINNGSTYDQIENAIQYAYNNVFVPMANTWLKEQLFKAADLPSIPKKYSIIHTYTLNGVQKKENVGYYLDDSPAITALLAKSGYSCESATSFWADYGDRANILSHLMTLNYNLPTHTFPAGSTAFSEINNILGDIFYALFTSKNPNYTWASGNNDKIIPNATTFAKQMLKLYGERYLSDYITIPSDTEIDALTLESAVIRFAPELINKFVDSAIITPAMSTSVRSILSYALLEVIAEQSPEEDIWTKLDTKALNPDTDEGWKAILAVFARYWANNFTDMNIPANATFDQSLQVAANWALDNYGSVLGVTSTLEEGSTVWQILDKIIFDIFPQNWLPATGRVLNEDGDETTIPLASSKNLIMDFLLGNVLDLKFEYLLDLFQRNTASNADLNNTPLQVVIGLVTRIVNAVLPDTLPTGVTTIEGFLDSSRLGTIITNLITGLDNRKAGIFKGVLPILCQVLDLATEQELEDPMILYPEQISGLSFNGTAITVKNNSSGVNTGFTDANGNFKQDKLYQVQIVSITSNNSAISITVNNNDKLLNGGEMKTFPVTGSLSSAGLVRFCLTYNILDENEQSLTTSPISTYFFTYASTAKDDSILEDKTYAAGQYPYVDGEGLNAHYVENAPAAYVRSWGELSDVSFRWGREMGEEGWNDQEAAVTFDSFSCTPTSPVIVANPLESVVTKSSGTADHTQELFKVEPPKVPDEEGNMVDEKIGNYAGTYNVVYKVKFGVTLEGENAVTYSIPKTVIIYDDFDLNSMVSNAMRANRQAAGYSSSSAFNTYLAALTAAQNVILKPKTLSTFNAAGFEQLAANLKSSIEALEETAQGAGVQSLIDLREATEGNNPEGMSYDDPDYFYFDTYDYKRYTYERFRSARNDVADLIDSQTINVKPEDYQTTEEYETALAAAQAKIPTLSLFEITYAKHMYEMNRDRLIQKTAAKSYLNHSKSLIASLIGNTANYSSDSLAAYTKALNFANAVVADNSATLKQSKVNTARWELVQAYKNLELRKELDYSALDAILEEAAAINNDDGTYTDASFDTFDIAYTNALSVPRRLEDTETNRQMVQDIITALRTAIDGLTPAGAEEGIEITDVDAIRDALGTSWDAAIKESYDENGELFYYVDGLAILTFLYPEDILTGEYDSYIANEGIIGTGDYVEATDGTKYYFVIYGDVDGDGDVSNYDADEIWALYNWTSPSSGDWGVNPFTIAADLNPDQYIDNFDADMVWSLYNWSIDQASFAQDGTSEIIPLEG